MDKAICHAGGCCRQILMNMATGEKNGIIERATERVLFGFLRIALENTIGITINIVTGICIC